MGISVLLSTLAATCHAATLTPRQQSEVWRETFPTANVEMAPSTFSHANTAPGAGVRRLLNRPHPAVARIVVPEQGAVAYGSGTLIDVREKFGLVITNWHVVRDATDTIEVIFPGGFTSKARALKVDSDWDLAALVIWRPSIEPVTIAAAAPRPGDQLTICGYGQGMYRSATGRCTQYYAPRNDFPAHMVELDVEARQGDSGGPIFNEQGELAGVLFGAGQGTTLGSFGGRVGAFLATLAPDIGRAEESLAENCYPCQKNENVCCCEPLDRTKTATQQSAIIREHQDPINQQEFAATDQQQAANPVAWPEDDESQTTEHTSMFQPTDPHLQQVSRGWRPVSRRQNLFEQMKTILAAIGLVAIIVQALRIAR